VWKLDRLGRNLRHLINTVHELAARGVGFQVLTGHGASINTATPEGKLVFGIFAALAEFERELSTATRSFLSRRNNLFFELHARTPRRCFKGQSDLEFPPLQQWGRCEPKIGDCHFLTAAFTVFWGMNAVHW
jgi:Resolvase, N terminal domain